MTAVQTISLGMLTPASAGLPRSVSVPFHLTLPAAPTPSGHRVVASAIVSVMPSAPAAGGRTLDAADIGIGVTAITPDGGARIASGFAYDPSAVRGERGRNPYSGAAAGRATLDDLRTPRAIVSGLSGDRDRPVTLTLTLGVLPRFFTPGAFTITITVTAQDDSPASLVQ